ncbi:MAG: endolytic transglycosylase MltG [Acidobacteriaceae bacterium]
MRKLLILLIIIAFAAAVYLGFATFVPYGGSQPKDVELRPGDSTPVIAGKLQQAGAVRSATAFLLYHYTLGGKRSLKAGEYEFDHPETVGEVHQHIVRGEVAARIVVVPEGFNMFDIAQAVENAGIGSRQDFLNEVRTDTRLISDLSPQATSLEGYMFPDTYRFSKSSTPREMAGTMVRRFRQRAQAIGLLQHGAEIPALVTMASVVEKETAVPEERSLVAGVFYNRLRAHIALATDPSVIYASLLAGTWNGAIHQSELHSDSTYNTYTHAGLPPGPICNPGVSALQAAMAPATTDYLYFVADNRGHHRFARTLEEHNHNVMLYREGK